MTLYMLPLDKHVDACQSTVFVQYSLFTKSDRVLYIQYRSFEAKYN